MNYRSGTWREAAKDMGVKGADGHPWKLIGMKPLGDGRAQVTMGRYLGAERIERSKEVGYDDPIEIVIASVLEGFDGPPDPDQQFWKFPAMTRADHLASHLFLIHGEYTDDITGKERAAALLHCHTTLHDLGGDKLGAPHIHTDETKG